MEDRINDVVYNDEMYLRWKQHTPIVYDTLLNSRIEWGTLSLAMGDSRQVATTVALRRHLLEGNHSQRTKAVSNAVGRLGAREAKDLAAGTYRRRVYFAPRTGEPAQISLQYMDAITREY